MTLGKKQQAINRNNKKSPSNFKGLSVFLMVIMCVVIIVLGITCFIFLNSIQLNKQKLLAESVSQETTSVPVSVEASGSYNVNTPEYKSIVGDTRNKVSDPSLPVPGSVVPSSSMSTSDTGNNVGVNQSVSTGSSSLSNVVLSESDFTEYKVNVPMDAKSTRKVTKADKQLVRLLMDSPSDFFSTDLIDRFRANNDFKGPYNVITNWLNKEDYPEYRIWENALSKGKILDEQTSFIEYNPDNHTKMIQVLQQVYVPVIKKKQQFEYKIAIDTETSRIVSIDFFMYDNVKAREELIEQREVEKKEAQDREKQELRIKLKNN